MPMSGVRLQSLPLHGELSTRSLAPAASTAGWLAYMAIAGSLEALGRYGVGGLPTVTLLSADTALASVGTAKATIANTNTTRTNARRAIVFLLSWRPVGSISFALGDAPARARSRRALRARR